MQQLVRESLNFKRGVEPKEAMQTGDHGALIKNKIIRALDELPQKIKIEISDLNPDYTEIEIIYKERTFFIGATWPLDQTNYNYYVQVIMKNGDAFTEDDAGTLDECIEVLKEWLKRINTLP